MKHKDIPALTGITSRYHPRITPDNLCSDGRNILFEDGKVKSRPGYAELGSNLPLTGSLLGLQEFKRLRSDDRTLVGVTEQHAYEYDPDTDQWSLFDEFYNTGTVGQLRTGDITNVTNMQYNTTAVLSSTKIAVAYRDAADSNSGKCIIGTISDSTITWGTAVQFEAGAAIYPSITALSDSKIAIAYGDGGDSNKGKCIVATVSGTVPSFGSIVEFESNQIGFCSIAMLDDSKIAVAYEEIDSAEGQCILATISGTTPSFGSAVTFENSSTQHISITDLSDSKIAIAYQDVSDSDKGKCILATISGTTPSFGSEVEFESGTTSSCNIAALTDSSIAIGFSDDSDSTKGKCVLATVSGTVPSFGSIVEFEGGSTTHISIAVMSSSRIAISYRDTTDTNKGKCILATVSGTVPSFGTEVEFEDDITDYCNTVMLSSTKIVIIYRWYDGDATTQGKCVVINKLNIIGSGVTWATTWPETIYDIKFGTDDVEGVGTPDTWFQIDDFLDTDELILNSEPDQNDLIAAGTSYVIRFTFISSTDDYYDTCEIIEGLGASDERQIITTNGVDPIKVFDGTTLDTLDMTGDGGSAPIGTARYCAYYYGHLILGWCNDGTNDLPQSIYWSARGYPTYWATAGASYEDLIDNADEITGLQVLKNRLYVLKEESIAECYYTGITDPAFEIDQNRVKGNGCKYERTCQNNGDYLFYRSHKNIQRFSGVGDPVDIGDEIIDFIEDNELSAYAYKCFSGMLKKKNLYLLFIVTSGTEPNTICGYNWKDGGWTIWTFADTMTCYGVYNDNIVVGDDSGNVYYVDLTETDDNGTDIDTYITTKDFPLTTDREGNPDYKSAFTLLETILTTETNSGTLQISCSLDFGNNWSSTIAIDQDTTNTIYEHVQNWIRFGEQVRFKINNVDGSQHAFEALKIGFEKAGLTSGR